jgi:hypothetical protein
MILDDEFKLGSIEQILNEIKKFKYHSLLSTPGICLAKSLL